MALPQIFKLADVVKPATMAEVRDAYYRVLGRLGVATTAWDSGAVVRTWTVAASAMLAAFSEQQAEIAKSGFLEFATGAWLRIKAYYDYNITPADATYATGDVVLVNTGGGIYHAGAGDLIVRNSITGKSYRNVAAFDLGAGDTVVVTVIALEAGSASNANTGAITEYVTEPFQRVTITNPTALIARDAESPAVLRARCSEKLGSLSPHGPWDAYSYAARSALLSTGESAGVTRTRVSRDGYGNVYLYVATGSGGIDGTVGDLATQLGAVDDAVQRNAAALGDTAHVVAATPVIVEVAYAVHMRQSGMSADAVRTKIAAALQAFFASHPIGGVRLDDGDTHGYVFTEALTAVIHNAVPDILRVALDSPTADTELAAAEVPALLHNPAAQGLIIVVSAEGLLQ